MTASNTVPTIPAVVHTRIAHARRGPVEHAFAHRSLSWLVDIDHLPRLPRGLGWAARFRADDHFAQPADADQTLRDRLTAYARSVGAEPPTGTVTALLSPRVAGYVFNPLTVFWCHDRSGRLEYVIAEVHNTYGQRHCYLVHTDSDGRAVVSKEFYVSPFNDVSGEYRLVLPEPVADGRIRLAVVLERPDHPPFTATVIGRSEPATVRAVIRAQLRAPLAPWLVALRIRIHGIRLWARGLRIAPRPPDGTRSTPATPSTEGLRR